MKLTGLADLQFSTCSYLLSKLLGSHRFEPLMPDRCGLSRGVVEGTYINSSVISKAPSLNLRQRAKPPSLSNLFAGGILALRYLSPVNHSKASFPSPKTQPFRVDMGRAGWDCGSGLRVGPLSSWRLFCKVCLQSSTYVVVSCFMYNVALCFIRNFHFNILTQL